MSPAPRGKKKHLLRRGRGAAGAVEDVEVAEGGEGVAAGKGGVAGVVAAAGASVAAAAAGAAASSSTSQPLAAIPGVEKPDVFILSAVMLGVETMHRMLMGKQESKATDPIVGVEAAALLRLLRGLDGASQDGKACCC